MDKKKLLIAGLLIGAVIVVGIFQGQISSIKKRIAKIEGVTIGPSPTGTQDAGALTPTFVIGGKIKEIRKDAIVVTVEKPSSGKPLVSYDEAVVKITSKTEITMDDLSGISTVSSQETEILPTPVKKKIDISQLPVDQVVTVEADENIAQKDTFEAKSIFFVKLK